MRFLWWTLLLVTCEILARVHGHGFLARHANVYAPGDPGYGGREGAYHLSAAEEAAFRHARGKRSAGCSCGEGTAFCFYHFRRKYCECENNVLVIDYTCEDCLCVNGVCNGSPACRCQMGFASWGDESNCVECLCEDENTVCSFQDGVKVCRCKDGFAELNGTCVECECGDNEMCYYLEETRRCPCTGNVAVPACIECDCSSNETCSYTTSVSKCTCLPNYAKVNGTCTECRCEGANTACSFQHGRKVCGCKDGFAELNGTCIECFCGDGHSCTLTNGSTVCICQEGHVEYNGTCRECVCGEGEICEFVDGTRTCVCKENYVKAGDTCRECFCGAGHRCEFVDGIKKLCACRKAFAQNNGTCEECKCGGGHDCEFLGGEKVCQCAQGYAERDGICLECSCGNDTACVFDGEDKVCFCERGYVEKNGVCREICETNSCHFGTCEVDGDSFNCKCDIGFGGSLCDQKLAVSKEATYVISALISITLFWIVLVAVYLVKRRRKRYQNYRKEDLTTTRDEGLLMTPAATSCSERQ